MTYENSKFDSVLWGSDIYPQSSMFSAFIFYECGWQDAISYNLR